MTSHINTEHFGLLFVIITETVVQWKTEETPFVYIEKGRPDSFSEIKCL